MGDVSPLAEQKKKKKLPFKPTALRRAAPPNPTPSDDDKKQDQDGDDDDLELFRRSREMAPIVAADRERRLRKKQKQMEERRRRSSASGKRRLDDCDDDDGGGGDDDDDALEASPRKVLEHMQIEDHSGTDEPATAAEESFRDLVTPPPSKRSRTGAASRHIDTVDEAQAVPVDSPTTKLLRSTSKTVAGPSTQEDAPTAAQPTTQRSTRSTRSTRSAHVIAIDSDSESETDSQHTIHMAETPSKRRDSSVEILGGGLGDSKTPSPQPAEEDDEFQEYVRKAEEQRARDQALLGSGPSGASGSTAKEKTEILVTSQVPGSKSCCMRVLFDKSLRLIRDTWIATQLRANVELEMDQNDDVVLTWRRQKVYTSSTLLNLGIRPEGNGRLTADGYSAEGFSSDRTRVHMEAWTPTLFKQMEADEELRRRRDAGELSDREDEPAAPPEEPQEVKIRVILKARGLEDVGLTVRPETTVETLLTGFCAQRNVAPGKDVGLFFDGDRLEEHITMDEAEIDDMDTLEVHIK